MNEILPGVFHWTAHHPKIDTDVSCYYVEPAGALIDPMLPADGIDWFTRRDTKPALAILTNRHHYRDCDEFRSAFSGLRVVCNEKGLHEFADGGPQVDGFSDGDRLADGIKAIELGVICDEDTALHIDVAEGVIAFADGVINYGGLGFVPEEHLGDDPEDIRRRTKEVCGQKLLPLEFDHILVAHGAPIVGDAKVELQKFVES